MTLTWVCSDGSGSIDREEFLQIPQIANNPLASRLIAIFDEEYVYVLLGHLYVTFDAVECGIVAEEPWTSKNLWEV